MDVKSFIEILGADFYTGVPDSQLKPLCDYLMEEKGISRKHIIAANEGNCVGIAAGYYLVTGKTPVVYMQNSGIGNTVNPVASLLHPKVYGIPCIFIIGWRGEPGVHDEPQHIYQGEVTLKLLEDMDIKAKVLSKDTSIPELESTRKEFQGILSEGKSVAFVIRKGALQYDKKIIYQNKFPLKREEIIHHIASIAGDDPVISTTGKASRELFEIREKNHQGHKYDFLTVGSMGHSSSIALGIALNKPAQKIWCIDGDGAALMHMGAMAIVGSNQPNNLVHIVINNEAHETVGGMPTVANNLDFVQIAKGCGYPQAVTVSDETSLTEALVTAKESKELFFLEVKAAIGSREDLGRPTTSAVENKVNFMEYLKLN